MKNTKKILISTIALSMLMFAGIAPTFAVTTVDTNARATMSTSDRIMSVRERLSEYMTRMDNAVNHLREINQKLQARGHDMSMYNAKLDQVIVKHDIAKAKILAFQTSVSAYQNGQSTENAKVALKEAVTAIKDFLTAAKALHAQEKAFFESIKADVKADAVISTNPVNSILPNSVEFNSNIQSSLQ
ncbi:hypothetical protein IPF86_01980 [Candidatus Nomurabacteria bacterium]|nr:MAG: hypothetical protein IPF86_01980 [Candidatus Nomurabacteria bacterium]